MEIYFNEKEVLEIVKSDKSRKFEVNEIEKIYVTYKYCIFFKVYYLKIKTKNGNEHSIKIERKYKSRIKREITQFIILMNWGRMIKQV
ncbi:hypothetical protein [Flavobacterium sp.]|uniref:hypothetical protein n=1 Tax=Flavobacterium sp. TaxID=239 RepID=UPI004047BAF5